MEPGARPVGTTIPVRDLFYNAPARMKFLKKDVSEGAFVGETVNRVALSHPEVSISFIREGKQLYKTPGDGSLKSAVYAVLGRDFAKDLLPVQDESGGYRVSGLVTPPRACPGQPRHAVLLHQRALRQEPHHDGRAGKRLSGHPDAGQVPRLCAGAGNACPAGGCECASRQNRGALLPRKRRVERLPRGEVGAGPAGQRGTALHFCKTDGTGRAGAEGGTAGPFHTCKAADIYTHRAAGHRCHKAGGHSVRPGRMGRQIRRAAPRSLRSPGVHRRPGAAGFSALGASAFGHCVLCAVCAAARGARRAGPPSTCSCFRACPRAVSGDACRA